MKKILIAIGFLIGFYSSFSQTFLTPRSSPTTTVQDSRLRALLNFYYPHTHGLTLNGGLDTLGMVLYEDSSSHVWYRDTVSGGGHKWSMLLKVGDAVSGVSSFNTRTGAVTLSSGDVVTALGFTPVNPNGTGFQYIAGDGSKVTFPTIPAQINITDAGLFTHSGTYPNYTFTGLTPTQQQVFTQGANLTQNNFWVTGANVLGMTGTAAFGLPTGSTSQRPSSPGTGYFRFNTDSSATETYNGSQWVKTGTGTGVTGVTSFNTRTGAVTLTSGDVTSALTFTPYNSSNPSGYISNIGGLVTAGANITITGSGTSGSPYVIVGTSSGSVFNQDSIKHRFVDTGSTARNLYPLAWDSVNRKWILVPPGTGGGGTGTVTNFSFTAANGFTGNVTNPSTVPALTVGTSITGLLFGNGTAMAAATVSTPLTYSTGTLGIQAGGTSQNGYISSTDWNTFNGKINLTSLSVTSPLLYNNTTGVFSIQVANTSQNGYLSSTDWNTFNGKQGALTLTTTGTSGAATLIGTTLNIPNYATGGGSQTLTYTQLALNNTLSISGGNSQTFLVATHALAGLMDSASKAVVDSLRLRTYTWPVFNIFAANGLTAAAGDSFYLGGALNQNTTIATAGFSYSITGLPSKATALATDSVIIENAAGQQFKLPVPSGGSGLTGGGGFSPLFTNGVSGSTLTFTASNAAANTAFGNFTGSSAAAAFGKLPLAAMATGTLNTLIGYDGSGNPSGITVSTGLSLSSGVLTATASIGGSIAATQIAFGSGSNTIAGESPFTYNSTTNVLNSDTITSHKFIGDSLKLNLSVQANRGFGGATKYFAVGNSITFGLNATVFDSSYVACNGRLFQLPVVDSGVSSTLTPAIASMHLRNITYPNTFVSSIMGGFNNARNTNALNNRPTINNIVYSYKAVWWNQFAGPVQNATSGTGVTRTGTWNTSFNAIINAGGKTTTAAYTSTAGAYIEYAFTDSTVGALCYTPTNGPTSVTVSIDGSVVQTLSTAGKFDGLGAYLSVSYGMFPIIVTGLSNGAHTLRITNVSGGLFIVDCFASFVPANSSNSMALIFYHAPKQNAAGYAGNPNYSNAAADTINSKIDSLAAALPSAWPIYVAKTNTRYNVTTGLSSDNIHPNNTGHKQISLAAADAVNGTPPSPGVIFAQYNPDGSFAGFVAQSEKTGQKNKLAFTTSNGLQDIIINNPTMGTDNAIDGANYKLSFINFLRMIFDSTKITQGIIVQNGAISAVGPSATIRVANRGADTTQKGFEWYATNNKMSFYDEFSNRNMFSSDTSLRIGFFVDPTEGNFNSSNLTAGVHIGANLTGRADHAPLKMNFGTLMATPQKGAFETDSVGGGLWWTRKNGIRVRLDSPTVAAGGVTTVGTFSGSSIANGASISTNTITFGPADGTNPGMVTTGAQTLAGAKTFTTAPILTTTSTIGQGWIATGTGGQGGWGTTPNIYNIDGALTGNRSLGGSASNFDLTLGNPDSLGAFTILAKNGILLRGAVRESRNTIGDADQALPSNFNIFQAGAPSLTANRTITLPAATLNDGRKITICNLNTTAFHYLISGNLLDPNSTSITQLDNASTYVFESHGGSNWFVTSVYRSGAIKYNHTIFAPTTGGTITLINNQYNIVNPTTGIATLTVTMPASPVNNDVVYVKFTQSVAAVTYAGNGNTVVGGLVAPLLGSVVTFTFDSGTSTWY